MTKKGRKRNAEILSIRDFEMGVTGYVGEIENMTRENGEIVTGSYGQDLATLTLLDLADKSPKKYWFDAGLRGTFKLAKIKPGEAVAIVHTGDKQIPLENGQMGKVQTYDVFDAEI